MTIQELIDNAVAGSIVQIPAGIYHEQLLIDKSLTLQGPPLNAGVAIINAGGLTSIPTIQILGSNVTIDRITIEDGPLHAIQIGSATYPNLTNIIIKNNIIRNHGNAGIITNHNAALTIDNNTIEGNGQGTGFNRGGIILYPHGLTSITKNLIINNAIEGIFARESNSGLTIDNNIIENHSNSGISLAWNQRHTSILNNQIKNCGTGDYDEQGGIVITQSQAEIIQGNYIDNCKRSGIFWGWVPDSGSPPDEILIQDNIIENSSSDAIYLFSQGPGGFLPPDLFPLEPYIEGNILRNNHRAGVYISNLYYYSPGNAKPTIHNNQLLNNEWGVLNSTSQTIDAIYNWWGASDGPYNLLLNPAGTGNPVSNNVNFIPWLSQPPIIEIIGCKILSIDLERYDISSLSCGFSKLKLFMKITGEVLIKIGDTEKKKTFEKRLLKVFRIPLPTTTLIKPVICSLSDCCAKIIDENLTIKIESYVLLDMQAQCNLLIPSFGYPPMPDNKKEVEQKPEEFTNIESIQVWKVFHSCWFKIFLNHHLDL